MPDVTLLLKGDSIVANVCHLPIHTSHQPIQNAIGLVGEYTRVKITIIMIVLV